MPASLAVIPWDNTPRYLIGNLAIVADHPRNGSWTDGSVRFSGFPARRDDAVDCIPQGGATPLGSRKSVQSRL
ncbi:MAG: hypothetical protein JNM52_05285 [Betaproteobacteria bacterium]|nr:hypothetical protein [Betaproteobacteria bacterium]